MSTVSSDYCFTFSVNPQRIIRSDPYECFETMQPLYDAISFMDCLDETLEQLTQPLFILADSKKVDFFELMGKQSIDILYEPAEKKRYRLHNRRYANTKSRWSKRSIICECGRKIHRGCYASHLRTDYHKSRMAKKN